jgi:hypothetical protein
MIGIAPQDVPAYSPPMDGGFSPEAMAPKAPEPVLNLDKDAPKEAAPKGAPKSEAPKSEAPKSEASKAEAPKAEGSKAANAAARFKHRLTHGNDETAKPFEEPAAEAPKVEAPKEAKKPVVKKAKGYEDLPLSAEALEKVAGAAASAAASAAVEKMGEREKVRSAEPAPSVPSIELTDEEKHQLAVLEQMEQDFPEEKGIKDRAQKYLEAVARWEQAHPGDEFDPESEAGIALKAKHKITWDDKRFAAAEKNLQTAPLKTEMERMKQELENTRRELDRQTKAPLVREASIKAAESLAQQLDPALKDVIDPRTGRVVAEKFEAVDPEVADIYRSAVEASQNFAQAVHSAFSGLDTPLIQPVAEFCKQQEKAILGLPADQQLDENGRKFAARSEWLRMKPDEREKRWTLDADIVTSIATSINLNTAREQAKAEQARIAKILERKGAKAPAPAPVPEPKKSKLEIPPEEKPLPESFARPSLKPVSPSAINPVPSAPAQPAAPASGFFNRFKTGTLAN